MQYPYVNKTVPTLLAVNCYWQLTVIANQGFTQNGSLCICPTQFPKGGWTNKLQASEYSMKPL